MPGKQVLSFDKGVERIMYITPSIINSHSHYIGKECLWSFIGSSTKSKGMSQASCLGRDQLICFVWLKCIHLFLYLYYWRGRENNVKCYSCLKIKPCIYCDLLPGPHLMLAVTPFSSAWAASSISSNLLSTPSAQAVAAFKNSCFTFHFGLG